MTYSGPPRRGRPGEAVPPAEVQPIACGEADQGRSVRLRFALLAAAALAMVALLVWSALPRPAAGLVVVSSTPIAPGRTVVSSIFASTVDSTSITPMPVFHDWHVAYVDSSETVRAVSIYGGQAVGGLPAPGLAAAAANMNGYTRFAALSPDGHYLAYARTTGSGGPLMLLDVDGGALPQPYAGTGSLHALNLIWSPDSSKLAFESNVTGNLAIYYISPKGLPPQAVPGVSGGAWGIYDFLGWIDDRHLVVLANVPASPTPGGGPYTTLGSLDVITGQFRSIALLPPSPRAYLAPDGARVVVDGADGGTGSAIEVVDVATGATRALPNLTRQVGLTWRDVAWKPGDHVLAVTTFGPIGSSGTAGLVVHLLDLDHDTSTDVSESNGYALGWSPDGQSLIVGTPTTLTGEPTGDLWVITFPAKGAAQALLLTHSAAAFLGFIRTA